MTVCQQRAEQPPQVQWRTYPRICEISQDIKQPKQIGSQFACNAWSTTKFYLMWADMQAFQSGKPALCI